MTLLDGLPTIKRRARDEAQELGQLRAQKPKDGWTLSVRLGEGTDGKHGEAITDKPDPDHAAPPTSQIRAPSTSPGTAASADAPR